MPTDEESGEPDPTAADPAGADAGAGAGAGEGRQDAPRHDEAGLDLARAITRATAGAGGPRSLRRSAKRAKGRRAARGRVSGAHPDERDPQLLDDTVARLVADSGWAVDLKVGQLFGRWAALVGDEVAAHSTPEAYAEGRLVVRTDSTAWATQLTLLAPSLVRRLNEELGDGTVRVIDVQGPVAPSWRRGARSIRGARGPRDTYG